jgi:hypothetical protein
MKFLVLLFETPLFIIVAVIAVLGSLMIAKHLENTAMAAPKPPIPPQVGTCGVRLRLGGVK